MPASQPASARNSLLPTKPECHTDPLPLPYPPRLPNRMELNPLIRFDPVPELQKKKKKTTERTHKLDCRSSYT